MLIKEIQMLVRRLKKNVNFLQQIKAEILFCLLLRDKCLIKEYHTHLTKIVAIILGRSKYSTFLLVWSFDGTYRSKSGKNDLCLAWKF